MGLFDEITWKAKLPDDAPAFVKKCPVFQTYDLGRGMGQFTISTDGVLSLDCYPSPMNYARKKIEMYASNLRGGSPGKGKDKGQYIHFTENGEDSVSITYTVQIRNGKVSSIKEKWREAKPARPIKEMK